VEDGDVVKICGLHRDHVDRGVGGKSVRSDGSTHTDNRYGVGSWYPADGDKMRRADHQLFYATKYQMIGCMLKGRMVQDMDQPDLVWRAIQHRWSIEFQFRELGNGGCAWCTSTFDIDDSDMRRYQPLGWDGDRGGCAWHNKGMLLCHTPTAGKGFLQHVADRLLYGPGANYEPDHSGSDFVSKAVPTQEQLVNVERRRARVAGWFARVGL